MCPCREEYSVLRPGAEKVKIRPKRNACQYGRGGEKRDPGRREVPVSTAGEGKSEIRAEEKCLSVRPGAGKVKIRPKKLRKYIIFVGLVTFLLTFLKISKFG